MADLPRGITAGEELITSEEIRLSSKWSYASYSMFRASFMKAVSLPKELKDDQAELHLAGFQDIGSIFNNVNLHEVYDEVSKNVLANRSRGVTKPDYRLLESISQLATAVDTMEERGINVVQKSNAQRIIELVRNFAHGAQHYSASKNRFYDISPHYIIKEMGRLFGLIGEDLLVANLNENSEAIGLRFLEHGLSKEIPKVIAQMGNTRASGIRGAQIVKAGKEAVFTKARVGTPLVDASVIVDITNPDGAVISHQFNLSIKHSFNPKAERFKAISTDWGSIIGEIQSQIGHESKTAFGLLRLIAYMPKGKSFDQFDQKALQTRMVLNQIPQMIGGTGLDKADFLVINHRWYPVAKIVNAVISAGKSSPGMTFAQEHIDGFLLGMGEPIRRDPLLKATGSERGADLALQNWTKHINFSFPKTTISWHRSILNQL